MTVAQINQASNETDPPQACSPPEPCGSSWAALGPRCRQELKVCRSRPFTPDPRAPSDQFGLAKKPGDLAFPVVLQAWAVSGSVSEQKSWRDAERPCVWWMTAKGDRAWSSSLPRSLHQQPNFEPSRPCQRNQNYGLPWQPCSSPQPFAPAVAAAAAAETTTKTPAPAKP